MAVIHKIIPFSCVDGPGNRTVIFFQHCNFACTYCHNPETIGKCINCGECISVCPVHALSDKNGKVRWHSDTCVNCNQCIKICSHSSSPKTQDYSIQEVFEEIRKVKPFIEGITVSGGECTLHAEFLIELFRKIKKELGITCFVDTNGSIDLTKYEELVDLADGFMLDVKSFDKQEHILLTGVSNETVLNNLKHLLDKNKLYEVRTVIAHKLNNAFTVREVAQMIKNKCIYKLIPYRKYGVRQEGLIFHGETGPDESQMNDLKEIAMKHGAMRTLIVKTVI